MSAFGSEDVQDDGSEIVQTTHQVETHEKLTETKRGKIILGRDYYYSLLDKATTRHWAIPISFNYSIATSAFDNDSQSTDIATGAFGGPITLEDIYLFSRLGDQNLVGILPFDPFAPGDGNTLPSGQPPSKERTTQLVSEFGTTAQFGSYANDLYTTLLAPMQIDFNVRQQEAGANISAVYNFDIADCWNITAAIGATLPVKSFMTDVDLAFENGTLFDPGAFAQGLTEVTENTLVQFYNDYQSTEDFFIREVLEPKGIAFEGRQVEVGIGDFALFGLVDFGGMWQYTDGLQVGLTIVFPSGRQASGDVLFEPSLGGGAYRFEPFFNAIFNSPSPVFNPTINLVGSIALRHSTDKTGGTRIGQTVTIQDRVTVESVPDLIFPARFGIPGLSSYYVGLQGTTTSELNSTIPAFADSKVPASIKPGSRFQVGIGNYFFNVFDLGFRLGLFYYFDMKFKDSVKVDPCYGNFDTCTLEKYSEERRHSIGANLTYKFRNMLELNVGTQDVIGGRNTKRVNEFFASIIAVF